MNDDVSPRQSSGRASVSGARLLLFALVALLAAACGREAIPRVATSPAVAGRQEAALPTTADTPTPAAAQPAPAATSAQPNGDPRAQGDPSAPITVIEYGDYQ